MRRITLGILTGMLACATVQAVQITDDFESYTPGAWNTTEMAAMGWAYYDAFQNPVIGVGYSISGQGMRYNASNDALPIWGQAANGKGRVDATHNTITYWLNVVTCNNFYKLGHWNEGNGTLSSVDLKADWSVKLDTASGAFTLGAWESGSWLKIDLEFEPGARPNEQRNLVGLRRVPRQPHRDLCENLCPGAQLGRVRG